MGALFTHVRMCENRLTCGANRRICAAVESTESSVGLRQKYEPVTVATSSPVLWQCEACQDKITGQSETKLVRFNKECN